MTISARHDPRADPAAPLGVPVIVLALVLLATPVLASETASHWAGDYGALFDVALALYLASALRLLCWGATVRRTHTRGR